MKCWSLERLTEIYFVCNIIVTKLYQKLKMITRLPMNAIIGVSFLNFLFKIPPYHFIFLVF